MKNLFLFGLLTFLLSSCELTEQMFQTGGYLTGIIGVALTVVLIVWLLGRLKN